MYQGQIKDQIKGQESSLLWLTQNNWFHKSIVVEAFHSGAKLHAVRPDSKNFETGI